MAADTYVDDLDGTAISATFVNECLENCFSQQRVAVLDCCRSGGFAIGFRTKGSKPAGGENTDRASHLSPLAPTGVYVLSSSDVDQASFAGGGSLDLSPPYSPVPWSMFSGRAALAHPRAVWFPLMTCSMPSPTSYATHRSARHRSSPPSA